MSAEKHQSQQESKEVRREKLLALESVMKGMPQVDVELKHYFAPGLYLREMRMPKDVMITGKIHKTEHYCVLAHGSVVVVTDEGRKELHAPAVIHSLPGTKRALYSAQGCTWINVHHNPTDEQDLEKIECFYVAETFEELLGFQGKKEIGENN